MSINKKYNDILATIPEGVTLIAISKTHPVEAVMEAYKAGARRFGENRHRELQEKAAVCPKDIEWHFIGHMQSNKAKYIVPIASMIHSVDSLSLLEAIDKQAAKCGRTCDVLLELFVAQDETKSGLAPEEFISLIESGAWRDMQNVRLRGVMAMGSWGASEEQLQKEFTKVTDLFNRAKAIVDSESFDTISMGMSGDYKIAIEAGSTMVRVGSSIFGERDYNI